MGPFDRFNDRAKRVLALAQDEAIRFNHNYIGGEHLLLGIVREGTSIGAGVLQSLGVSQATVRQQVVEVLGRQGTGMTAAATAIPSSMDPSVILASHLVAHADRLDASVRRALGRASWES